MGIIGVTIGVIRIVNLLTLLVTIYIYRNPMTVNLRRDADETIVARHLEAPKGPP